MGFNLNVYYYFYKGLGVTAGLGFKYLKNERAFDVDSPPPTVKHY